MTGYTVVWTRSAENDLAEIWMNADDPAAVTAASHAIDLELADNPSNKGSDVAEGLRALVVPPLRILFSVLEQGRVVEVAKVMQS